MARIGNWPIEFGDDVDISIDADNTITVEGPKGTLTEQIDPVMTVKVEDDQVIVRRPSDQKRHRTVHGLSRTLIKNMIEGVTEGYKKELIVIGVGYRAEISNGALELALGYSHPIYFLPPEDVDLTLGDTKGIDPEGAKDKVNARIIVEGVDKQLVGQVAAKIRELRPPEAYKGKGVRYIDESISLKAGKTAVQA